MPQLDTVTLFSQAFWLLFLYFFCFLIFLRYYFPYLNKVFRFRSIFNNEARVLDIQQSSLTSGLVKTLVLFKQALVLVNSNILFTYDSNVLFINKELFKAVNSLYISLYNLKGLQVKIFKVLYL